MLYRRFFPKSLKYRLFLSYIFLIIIPLSFLSLYYFNQSQQISEKELNQQSQIQLENLNQSLQDLLTFMSKTLILLEQDDVIASILKNPEDYHLLERIQTVKAKFNSINNSLFITNPFVYLTLIDQHGNFYNSYMPRTTQDFELIKQEEWYIQATSHILDVHWNVNEKNHIHSNLSQSPYLLSHYTMLHDSGGTPYGVYRISVDYSQWFKSVTQRSSKDQDFFLVNQEGDTLASSNTDQIFSYSSKIIELIRSGEQRGYVTDAGSSRMLNFQLLDNNLNWYLVNSIPMDALLSDVRDLRMQYMLVLAIILTIYILAILAITSTITRPIQDLQKEMAEIVNKDLNIHLPEHKYSGEMLSLSRSFNQMVKNIRQLIDEVKLIERQKEQVRFQALLSQMTPHFVFNTLNTIKWVGIKEKNKDIPHICMALGQILKAGMNLDLEIISLKEELKLVDAYISIQQYRFGQRFDVIYQYDSELADALVLKLSLQPLVENSIQHGMSNRRRKVQIIIRVYMDNQKLYIEVEDNGVGSLAGESNKSSEKGIGLRNLSERLKIIFKEEGNVSLEYLEQGARVTIEIPFLISKKFIEAAVPSPREE